MRKAVLVLFFALGFFSLLSQTVIMREFIISFGGGELGIGLFFFFWFFWVGAGSFLTLTLPGKCLNKYFSVLAALYPLPAFLQIIAFISLRSLAGLNPGEFFPFEKIFLYLFLCTSLVSVFTGMLFSLGIAWLKKNEQETGRLISFSYIMESLGSFAAGVAVTILITTLVPSSLIIFSGAFIFSLLSFLVNISLRQKKAAVLNAFILLFILLTFIFMQGKISGFTDRLRLANIMPQAELIDQVHTPYQQVILGKLPNQTVIFSNGTVLSSMPEIVDADRESALFISLADNPRHILVLGYGAENTIVALLKFPVEKITWCMEDRDYYKLISNNIPQEFKQELDIPRLELVFQPPQLFLKDNPGRFDLVIVYTPDPSTLVLNRFFTREFYFAVLKSLTAEGVLATRITGAENYIGEEISNYGSAVYYTLESVFSKIIIVPGETNWFFAGAASASLTDNPQILKQRIEYSRPASSSFHPETFTSILVKEKIDFVREKYIDNPLFKNTGVINQDSRPLTFFLHLLVMAGYSQSFLVKLFKGIYLAGAVFFVMPLIIFLLARILFLLRIENVERSRFLFNVKIYQFFSGFLGFSYHLTLIFLFQNKFGTIFQYIGLVNALFMLGLCIGGVLGNRLLQRFSASRIITAILVFQAVVILVSYPFLSQNQHQSSTLFFLFIVFFLLSGVITGSSYSLCADLFGRRNVSLLNAASNLQLLDHWGAALAGLICGIFMLPLLGVFKTLLILEFSCVVLAGLFLIEIVAPDFITRQRLPNRLSFPYIRTSYVMTAVVLSFLVSYHLVSQKTKNLGQQHPVVLSMINKDCHWQNEPFLAYACFAGRKTEYVFESKQFASHIHGFSGPINLVIKADSQGTIKDIRVAEHRETTVYVQNLDSFIKQFYNRSLNEEFSLDNIDAMSGATVTSRAIVDIVNETGRQLRPRAKNKPVPCGFKADIPALILVFFVLSAVVLSRFFPDKPLLRKIHLILTAVVLGFMFNITFSLVHLAGILTFNLPAAGFLPVILIYWLPLLLGLLFGRLWCGWLCPFGALQEILGSSKLSMKISANLDQKARYFKYVVLVFFILAVLVKGDASLFKQEPLAVFFIDHGKLYLIKILAVLVLFFSVFFFRFWCRYFCACGAFLSLFNKFFLFRKFFLKFYKNCPLGVQGYFDIDCIQCSLCNKGKYVKR